MNAVTPADANPGMPYSPAPDSRLESIVDTTLDSRDNFTEPDDFLPAWGQWMITWDPYETIADRFNAEDIWRLSKPAEQYLYCMEYIPGRGHKDDLLEEYNLELSYHEYDVEPMIYSMSAIIAQEEAENGGEYSITVLLDLKDIEAREQDRKEEEQQRFHEALDSMTEEENEGMPPDSAMLNSIILDIIISSFSKKS